MRLQFVQDAIDAIRGKKPMGIKLRSQPTDAFKDRMSAYLKMCTFFRYPETKNDYAPDFSKTTLL